ncbi:MAG: helix-turn-helix transcriptional regulator [Clostridia bacterium]|nr:helix-turn-helix transcriptional regulator [Clostridia bacterium]
MGNEEKEFPRGQLNPTILSTLLVKDKYGYEIIEEIKQKTGIEIKQPSLYSSLKRMETQKFISSYWQDSTIGGKRHYYCLTAVGREFLQKNPVDFSIFTNTKAEINEKSPSVEKSIQNTFKEIGEKIKNAVEDVKIEENPKFAQQDNIFNAIKKDFPKEDEQKETKTEEPKTDDCKQYDLFANIKNEEKPKVDTEKQRILNNKKSSDPYQLKHLEENELKNEFEKIRNQKLGISQQTTPLETDKIEAKQEIDNQPNIWLDRNNFMKNDKDEEDNVKVHIAQSEKDEPKENIKDDGKFITERINIEDIPKQRISPSTLNIESNNYSTFLNSKASINKEEREDQEKFKHEVAEMYSRKIEQPKYDYNQSLANMEDKFQKHKNTDFNSQDPEKLVQEEVYERVKNTGTVFNSYKSLEAYFNSKGIGFYSYTKKEKSANQYVNYSLIRFIRGIIFSVYALVLAFSFYFGINAVSVGKVSYIIFPILSISLTVFYYIDYYKTRKNKIIQVREAGVSPVILPVISACAVLVIIAINMTIGFQSGNALYYFPLLMYPIFLSIHIALIVPLNKLISFCILKIRERKEKKI